MSLKWYLYRHLTVSSHKMIRSIVTMFNIHIDY